MAKGRRPRGEGITYRGCMGTQVIPAAEWEAFERLLAELIARAYVVDHPELFRRQPEPEVAEDTGRPSPAAQTDARDACGDSSQGTEPGAHDDEGSGTD